MPRPRGSGVNRYSVYDRRTDMPVIIGGTARECAGVMGVTVPSFRTLYSKFKTGAGGVGNRWEIYLDEPDDMEDEVMTDGI